MPVVNWCCCGCIGRAHQELIAPPCGIWPWHRPSAGLVHRLQGRGALLKTMHRLSLWNLSPRRFPGPSIYFDAHMLLYLWPAVPETFLNYEVVIFKYSSVRTRASYSSLYIISYRYSILTFSICSVSYSPHWYSPLVFPHAFLPYLHTSAHFLHPSVVEPSSATTW